MRRFFLGLVGLSMLFIGSCMQDMLLTLGKPGQAWWIGEVPIA